MLGALTVRWNVLLWGPTRTPHFGESQLTLPCFVFHQNCNSCDHHMKNKPSGVIRGKELQKLLIVKVALLQIQGPPVPQSYIRRLYGVRIKYRSWNLEVCTGNINVDVTGDTVSTPDYQGF